MNYVYDRIDPLQARITLHARYSQHPEPWHRWCWERSEIPAGARVLEIGCGVGKLWTQNAARIPTLERLVVCDASEAMVAATRRALEALGVRAEARVCRAEALPFEDGAFDLILAHHMLYHTHPPTALAECARVLRPGGQIAASCNGPNHMGALYDALDACNVQVTPDRTAEVFGLRSGPALMRACFKHVRVVRYDDALWVTEAADAVDYLRSLYDAQLDAAACARLAAHIGAEIAREGGFRIAKDVGVLLGADPLA